MIHKNTTILFLIFLFFSQATSTRAANYYISPSGSDSNSGISQSQPFVTTKKALGLLQPGDSLYFLPGTYPSFAVTQSGTADRPINLIGSNATITGGHFGLSVSGRYITVSGFTVVEAVSHGVHISGKNIQLSNMIARNNVTENRNPNGVCGSSSGWGSGFSIKLGSENISLKNSQVFNNCGEGLAITRGINVLIDNVTVYDNFSVNIYPDNTKNTTIQNSLSYCTGDSRFSRSGNTATGILIGEEDYAKWDNSGWGAQLENLTIVNNIVHNCYRSISSYSELGSGLRGALIAHNTLIGGNGISIFSLPGNRDIKIFNNISGGTVKTGSGIITGNNINTTSYSSTPNPSNPLSFIPASISSAVDAGASHLGITFDYRQANRPAGNGFDIGAFEVNSSTKPTPFNSPTFSPPTSTSHPSVSPTRHPTSPPTTTITPFTRPSSTITTRPATPTILPSSVPTIAKIVGDATGDGVVNLLDFSRWKLEYLGTLSTRTADFDLSGIVDLLDFSIWKGVYLR